MQKSIDFIRDNLRGIYEPQETEQFIVMIFRHLCGFSRADMIIHKNMELSDNLREEISRFTTRLKAHEPIQYVLGECDFLDFTFNVRPGVLIPRPETEELIELICNENRLPGTKVLDIGTGSGCIAVSVARLLPDASVTAWDVSEQALEIARENALKNKAAVDFALVDVLAVSPAEVPERFDIIVSNPPYVCHSEKAEMSPNVLRHEPHLALFVDDADPLLFYRGIAELGRTLLNPGGRLYFEINALFGSETLEMLRSLGYSDAAVVRDIHGKERMTRATFNPDKAL